MNKILETEEYVHVSNDVKATLEYKIAYAVKEEIRNHKWNQGTQGNILTWDEAMDEWMIEHYEKFVTSFRRDIWPKPQRIKASRFPFSNARSTSPTAPLHYRI